MCRLIHRMGDKLIQYQAVLHISDVFFDYNLLTPDNIKVLTFHCASIFMHTCCAWG